MTKKQREMKYQEKITIRKKENSNQTIFYSILSIIVLLITFILGGQFHEARTWEADYMEGHDDGVDDFLSYVYKECLNSSIKETIEIEWDLKYSETRNYCEEWCLTQVGDLEYDSVLEIDQEHMDCARKCYGDIEWDLENRISSNPEFGVYDSFAYERNLTNTHKWTDTEKYCNNWDYKIKQGNYYLKKTDHKFEEVWN